MNTYLVKTQHVCVCIKIFMLPTLGHQINCEGNSKTLAESREMKEIQISLMWGLEPKFQVQTHILLFLGQ